MDHRHHYARRYRNPDFKNPRPEYESTDRRLRQAGREYLEFPCWATWEQYNHLRRRAGLKEIPIPKEPGTINALPGFQLTATLGKYTPLRHYRRNADQDLRRLQRESLGDPESEKRYLLRCVRVGKPLPIEDWYNQNVEPLGIDEQDFKVLVTQLVQGYYWTTGKSGGQSMVGPRDWAWMARPLEDENTACFLAVRGYTRDRSNAMIKDDRITLGATVYSAEGLTSHPRYRWEIHPRNAWEYLQRYGYAGGADPSPEIPTYFYTSFERDYDLPPPVTPKARWGHGCETHGPDPCHADVPTQKMFGWARTSAPDRTTFSIFEARLYLGLDTEEGLP